MTVCYLTHDSGDAMDSRFRDALWLAIDSAAKLAGEAPVRDAIRAELVPWALA